MLRRMKAAMIVVCAACVALGACASVQSRVARKENLLSAAGFDVKPANTPRREAELKRLPPNKFVRQAKDDHELYLYADPVVCNCLYVGDQKAYDAYKQEVFQRQLADEQQMTAETYTGPWYWGGWTWGPWGWNKRFWWW